MSSEFSMEKRTAYRFSIVSTLILRCISELYTHKFKLSTAGWRILSIIGRYEPIFPGVAAQLTTMDADKVTRAVDRLVEMGLVVRNADSADRRRVILCLSSRGKSVFSEIEAASQQIERDLRSCMSADEWKQFDLTLDKIEAHGKQLFTREAARERFAIQPAGKTGAAGAGKRGKGKLVAPEAKTTRRGVKEAVKPAVKPALKQPMKQPMKQATQSDPKPPARQPAKPATQSTGRQPAKQATQLAANQAVAEAPAKQVGTVAGKAAATRRRVGGAPPGKA